MENEKRYGGAIVVPDDVEMHSPVDIVDDMVEALRFYESRTSAAQDNDLIRRGDLKNLLLKRSFFPAIVAAALKELPNVDAVELPKGKIGECVLWKPDSFEEMSVIEAIAVTDKGMRYCFRWRSVPVDSPKILQIMSREEAKRWLADVYAPQGQTINVKIPSNLEIHSYGERKDND